MKFYVFLCIVASAAAAEQISCYNCNSESNPSCADPFKAEDMKTDACTTAFTNTAVNVFNSISKGLSNVIGLEKAPPQASFSCVKTSYTVKVGDTEKKIVQRGCTLQNVKVCEQIKEKQNSDNFFCEECHTDGCNGSSTTHAAAFVLVSALALLFANYLHL